MMRLKAAVLALSLVGLACSASYEVGQMDPAAIGGSSAGGSSNPGGAAPTSAGKGSGTAAAAAMGVFSPQCVSNGPAPRPTGELAMPDVVWSRVSKFIWGVEHLPPAALPLETSYGWAGEVVDQGFAAAVAELNGVPGASYFVKRWLKLNDVEEPLAGDYDSQLARGSNVLLEVLLQSSWAPGHAGVFSESAWVKRYRSIPQRGTEISVALLSRNIPPPPPGVNQDLESDLPDRAAIEQAMGSPVCASCHSLINPLGYALGHFDREGEYRELDHDLPIDTSGTITLDGGQITFDDIADFGGQAADSCEANLAIVDQFFRVALTERGYDGELREMAIEAVRDGAQQQFVIGGRSYSALVKAYAQSAVVLEP
jgi:hypothetical protein